MEAFRGLQSQGLSAFYKGNALWILYTYGQLIYKSALYNSLKYMDHIEGKQSSNAAVMTTFFGISTLCDIMAHPLHVYQARAILQDNRKEFRTYRHFGKMLMKSIHARNSMNAWVGNVPVNLMYAVALSGLKDDNPFSKLLLSPLPLVLSYPILTCMRRLECQTQDMGMLPQRYSGLGHALKLVYQEEGPKGLYRGFLGFALSRIFLSSILVLVAKSKENPN